MGSLSVLFVLTATALADRHVGLEWEPRASDLQVTWIEAVVAATERGWRLPSAAELICFLGDAPADAVWLPPAGATFWSATGSPFARGDRVRAVCREPGGRFAIVLLDKGARAQRWGVRNPGRHRAPGGSPG